MRRPLVALLVLPAAVLIGGCSSPEGERTLGGGAGADTGNRGTPVVMHAGSKPYAGTPKLIGVEAASVEPASQAHTLSRAH